MARPEEREHERIVADILRSQGGLRSSSDEEKRARKKARIENERFDESAGRALLNQELRVVRSDLDPHEGFDFDEEERAEIDRLAREKAMAMVGVFLPEVLRFVAAGRTERSRMTRLWGALLHFGRAKASEAAEAAGVTRQAVEQSAALCEEEMARVRRRIAA